MNSGISTTFDSNVTEIVRPRKIISTTSISVPGPPADMIHPLSYLYPSDITDAKEPTTNSVYWPPVHIIPPVDHTYPQLSIPDPKRAKIVLPFDNNRLRKHVHTLIEELTNENESIKKKYEDLRNTLLEKSVGHLPSFTIQLMNINKRLSNTIEGLESELVSIKASFNAITNHNATKGLEVNDLNKNLQDNNKELIGEKDAKGTLLSGILLMQQKNETEKGELEKLSEELREYKKKDEERLCSICMENYTCMIAYPCLHLYGCTKCIRSYNNTNSTCPNCRQPVETWASVYF
jgi:hypothetical protein